MSELDQFIGRIMQAAGLALVLGRHDLALQGTFVAAFMMAQKKS